MNPQPAQPSPYPPQPVNPQQSYPQAPGNPQQYPYPPQPYMQPTYPQGTQPYSQAYPGQVQPAQKQNSPFPTVLKLFSPVFKETHQTLLYSLHHEVREFLLIHFAVAICIGSLYHLLDFLLLHVDSQLASNLLKIR